MLQSMIHKTALNLYIFCLIITLFKTDERSFYKSPGEKTVFLLSHCLVLKQFRHAPMNTLM